MPLLFSSLLQLPERSLPPTASRQIPVPTSLSNHRLSLKPLCSPALLFWNVWMLPLECALYPLLILSCSLILQFTPQFLADPNLSCHHLLALFSYFALLSPLNSSPQPEVQKPSAPNSSLLLLLPRRLLRIQKVTQRIGKADNR